MSPSKPSLSWHFFAVFLFILLAYAIPVFADEAESKPESSGPKSSIKLLLVGNSFSRDATAYLPNLALAGGKKLVSLNACRGSGSFENHANGINGIAKNPQSPQARIYNREGSYGIGGGLPDTFNLKEALTFDKWDFVTIQQYSLLSFKPETYEPYAHQVVDYIRQYAPQAEILVHETWPYREDDPSFKDGKFTSQKMYEGLKAAYAKLADTYHLRIIPVGDAFAAAKATEHWHYVLDPTYDFEHPKPGVIPNQDGSLNAGYLWTGSGDKQTLGLDAHHASYAGRYLGSAVMYEVLYGDSVEHVSYCPPELKPQQAEELRRIAHETMEAQKKGATDTGSGAEPAKDTLQ